eukprot:scaffold10229_cov129-Skeletonema_dohrnii-CCMP3373.AAC.2
MSMDNKEADDTMWCLALVFSIAVLFLSFVLQWRFAAASSAISLFLQTADMLRNSTIEKITSSCCAACGIAEAGADEIKLKKCVDCDLVRYCRDACQKNQSQHEEACKKRSTELRDELLFKLPESSHHGDCPICCLPMPLDVDKSTIMPCCSKLICDGCAYANYLREAERMLAPACPFCRKPVSFTDEEFDKYQMKRIEVNDPVAMRHEGLDQCDKGNYQSAFEWYSKAAELGDVEAHNQLSHMYRDGHGVEKDGGKEIYHLEEAAIGGHPEARYNLGIGEWNDGKTERAAKHFIIAATQGDDDSIKELLEIFKDGLVSKDDLAAALRAHQAAVDSAKSPQREAAEAQREAAEERFPDRQAFERYLLPWTSLLSQRNAATILGHGVEKDNENEMHHLKRLQLDFIPKLDTILDVTSGIMAKQREQ